MSFPSALAFGRALFKVYSAPVLLVLAEKSTELGSLFSLGPAHCEELVAFFLTVQLMSQFSPIVWQSFDGAPLIVVRRVAFPACSTN